MTHNILKYNKLQYSTPTNKKVRENTGFSLFLGASIALSTHTNTMIKKLL
jgi:hypothetical protein